MVAANYISKETRKKMHIICFDTETTGLGPDDEIIQLSIVDANTREEILNEYYRPSDALMERGWPEAASVTGIHPEDVEDCPSLSDPDVFDEVRAIFDSADIIIGYHVAYDIKMMENHGFDMSRYVYQDPMIAFATYYWTTHPDEKHLSKKGKECDSFMKWKSDGFGGKGVYINKNLSFAAEYLCGITNFGAHDSLNDVLATIDVWEAMTQIQEDVFFRGFAYDQETGEQILDDNGDSVYIDELGEPMINPNGYGYLYLYDYSRAQLAEIDS